jgi:hypothetical protein
VRAFGTTTRELCERRIVRSPPPELAGIIAEVLEVSARAIFKALIAGDEGP